MLFRSLTTVVKAPPLREHAEDVPDLAAYFLDRFTAEYARPAVLEPAALERLQSYAWPGNVRQLRSVLEAAVAMNRTGVIQAGDLHLSEDAAEGDGPSVPLNLEELEAWAVRKALEKTGGNNVRAARLLGIHRDTLLSKVKKYRIERPA